MTDIPRPARDDTDWIDWADEQENASDAVAGRLSQTSLDTAYLSPSEVDTTPVTAADFGLAVPQGVRAYANNTAQSIASGVYPVYLDLNATEYNENVGLFTVDLAGDRITVASAGLYLVSWDVNFADSSALREAYVTKNGGNAVSAAGAAVGGLAYRSFPMRLAAGDYVQVIAYVEGGAAVSLVTNAPFRCGLALHRIGL